MSERQINEMLKDTLENLNTILDSSKVVGKPIEMENGKIIIPLSKITFGFGVAGSELSFKKDKLITNNLIENNDYPFGGGTLGGVNVNPLGFIIIDGDNHKLIKFEESETLLDKAIDLIISFNQKSNKKSTKYIVLFLSLII